MFSSEVLTKLSNQQCDFIKPQKVKIENVYITLQARDITVYIIKWFDFVEIDNRKQ